MKGPCTWNVMLLIISIVYISCIYCCIIRYIPKNFDIPSWISLYSQYYIITIFNFTTFFMNELYNTLDNNSPIYNHEEVEENSLEIAIGNNQHATILNKKNRSIVHSNFTLDKRINKYKCNHCRYVF